MSINLSEIDHSQSGWNRYSVQWSQRVDVSNDRKNVTLLTSLRLKSLPDYDFFCTCFLFACVEWLMAVDMFSRTSKKVERNSTSIHRHRHHKTQTTINCSNFIIRIWYGLQHWLKLLSKCLLSACERKKNRIWNMKYEIWSMNGISLPRLGLCQRSCSCDPFSMLFIIFI